MDDVEEVMYLDNSGIHTVKNIDASKITISGDPTTDNGVGDRLYNDGRYSQLDVANSFLKEATFGAENGTSGTIQLNSNDNASNIILGWNVGGWFQFSDDMKIDGVFESLATNAEITTAGDDALITKDFADTYYANISGTPVDNQFAIFTDAETIEGVSTITHPSASVIDFPSDDMQLKGVNQIWATSASGYDLLFGATNLTVARHFLPDSDVTYDLGSAITDVWRELFIQDITAEGDVDIAGETRIQAVSMGSETDSFTIDANDYGNVIYVDKATAVTITLPDTLSPVNGQTFTVIMKGVGQVTIDPTGTTTINSATDSILNDGQWSAVQFVHLGSNTDDWHVFGKMQ